MWFTSLSSGSRQNAYLLRFEQTLILIDCGISYRKTKDLMHGLGVRPKDLKAVVLTHDHLDHTRGLKTLVKKNQIPVFAHPKIHSRFKEIPSLNLFPLVPEKEIRIDAVRISSRIVPHDATLTQGLRISADKSMVLLTDLGFFPKEHLNWAFDPHFLAVEANYDPQMLEESSYPQQLKERVRGKRGHLSNEESLNLVRDLAGKNLEQVCFLHLSENNNHPEKISTLLSQKKESLFSDLKFHIAKRTEALDWIKL